MTTDTPERTAPKSRRSTPDAKRQVKCRSFVSHKRGSVLIVDGDGNELLTIAPGSAITDHTAKPAADASLEAVGSFANAVLSRASEDVDYAVLLAETANASLSAIDAVVESFREPQRRRDDLAGSRAASVQRTIGAIAGVLTDVAYEADLTNLEFEQQLEVAIEAVRSLTGRDSEDFGRVYQALLVGPVAEADPEETARRARARITALYQQIMRQSLTTPELQNETGLSRQRIAQLRDEGKLFAFKAPHHRALYHPAWQLLPDNDIRPQMPELIAEAKKVNLEPIDLHLLMTTKTDDRPTGVELLDADETDVVLALIRAVDR